MHLVLTDYILMLGWIFSLVIIMGLAIPLLIWILNKSVGELNFWKELRRKNVAAGLFLAAFVLGVALIIAFAR